MEASYRPLDRSVRFACRNAAGPEPAAIGSMLVLTTVLSLWFKRRDWP
jgi:hypothetical protein